MVVAYEQRLHGDIRLSLAEGTLHFQGQSEVQKALRAIATRLDALGIPYAVIGGLALNAHGHERFTSDVDILVTRDGLRRIHEALEGRGYLPPFAGSKHLRDTENGVKIEFLVTGDFPGDGKPKPVAFPDPAGNAQRIDGVAYADLTTFVTLKLASGMTGVGRAKDLGDVEALIQTGKLSRTMKLDPYVGPTFVRLWDAMHGSKRRFLIDAAGLDPARVAAIEAAGAVREPRGDRAFLVTTDPDVARVFDIPDEADYLDAP